MKKRKSTIIAIAMLMALSLNSVGITALAETTTDAQRPGITTQPGSTVVNVNENVTLTVTAAVADGGTLSYQWFINTIDSNTNGAPINGATSASFSPLTRHDGTLFYYVVVTNTNNDVNGNRTASVTSNTARVTVNAAPRVNARTPSITTNPRDGTVLLNESFTLTVAAEVNDGGTLSFQWFRNTADRNTGGTAINGATARTYTPPTNSAGTTYYYVVVTNTNNNVNGTRTATITSGTAMVTVNNPINAQTPNITGQPEGGEVASGGRITLSVTAEVDDRGTLSYQWFRSESNSSMGGTLISGATGATFAPETNTVGVTYYYVVVTNTNNGVTGAGRAMAASSAVPVVVSTTPDAPLYFTAAAGADYVILTWEPPENDGGSEITRYQVSIDLVSFWIDADEMYEHTFAGLASEADYTFRVRAINAAGFGEEAELTVKTAESEAVSVTGVSIDEEILSIYVGESTRLRATVSPEDADDRSVNWKSSNTDIATVSENGVVTAHSPGTVIITVTTNDGGYSAAIIVKIIYMPDDNLLLWIGLGTLAPLGTGTGVYLWRRKRNTGK